MGKITLDRQKKIRYVYFMEKIGALTDLQAYILLTVLSESTGATPTERLEVALAHLRRIDREIRPAER